MSEVTIIMIGPDVDLDEVGRVLEEATKCALSALEKTGLSPRAADEFIKESVFNAWMGWDYEPAVTTRERP